MKYHKLYEQWNKVIKEEVYSNDLHSFIQYAYEIDELVEEKKIRPYHKLAYLKSYLKNSSFEYLGSGVDRTTWISPNEEIIKIVVDVDRSEINKKEIENFNRPDIDIFPRIEAYDERDYLWFVVQKVTPIGRVNTWEKYSKLFPKLFELATKFNSKTSPGAAEWVVMNLLQFKYFLKNKGPYFNAHNSDLLYYVQNAFRIRDPDLIKTTTEEVVSYFKKPDKNFAKLLRGVVDADVPPTDLHHNNLAYDEDWNIKLIDAG